MDAEIVTIGTELLLGQIVDTNSAYLSKALNKLGINVYYQSSVGDNKTRLGEVLSTACKRSELVVTTGGLGPTDDDITLQVVTGVLDKEMIPHQEALDHLKQIYRRFGKEFTPSQRKQAYYPQGSKLIPNPNGTALGMILETEEVTVVSLPGIPAELKPMVQDYLGDYLKERLAVNGAGDIRIESKVIKTRGIGEPTVEDKIKDLIGDQTNPTLATLVGSGEVQVRITAKGKPEEVKEMIEKMEEKIMARLGDYVCETDEN